MEWTAADRPGEMTHRQPELVAAPPCFAVESRRSRLNLGLGCSVSSDSKLLREGRIWGVDLGGWVSGLRGSGSLRRLMAAGGLRRARADGSEGESERGLAVELPHLQGGVAVDWRWWPEARVAAAQARFGALGFEGFDEGLQGGLRGRFYRQARVDLGVHAK